jgi:cytochrome c oxidase subunit 3
MPVIGDHAEIERRPKLGGGGPGKIPHHHGYGGGDDGDHDEPSEFFAHKSHLRRYYVGVAVFIGCVTVFFITMTVPYIIRLGIGRYDQDHARWIYDWKPLILPYSQLLINSVVLLLSSATLELARRSMIQKAEFAAMGIVPPRLKADLPWLGFTVLLGFAFLAGQFAVWNILRRQGVYLHSNPSSSFFYMFTGLHAIHLAGGLIVLLYTACAKWLINSRFESQRIAVDVTGWYWHFMGLLWLAIFALLHFARG